MVINLDIDDETIGRVWDDVLHQAEITVLGIGNVILRDEGFGVRVAEWLKEHYTFPREVQIIDGGTLGIELLQFITGTKRLLIIDSINGGVKAGTRFRFAGDKVNAHFQTKLSAHEVGIQDVLTTLSITGKNIPEVVVIGVEPYDISAGVELSAKMKQMVEPLGRQALTELKAWGVIANKREQTDVSDYNIIAEEKMRKFKK